MKKKNSRIKDEIESLKVLGLYKQFTSVDSAIGVEIEVGGKAVIDVFGVVGKELKVI